mmetsp:Transcript_5896/g.19024  ORF Transcript_5896/g.19024 Transcript_5896/m.19024 type:complete len:233 (-) Transcript_5896:76-774(-)
MASKARTSPSHRLARSAIRGIFFLIRYVELLRTRVSCGLGKWLGLAQKKHQHRVVVWGGRQTSSATTRHDSPAPKSFVPTMTAKIVGRRARASRPPRCNRQPRSWTRSPPMARLSGDHRPKASCHSCSFTGSGVEGAVPEKPERSHPSVIESPRKTRRVCGAAAAAAACCRCRLLHRTSADQPGRLSRGIPLRETGGHEGHSSSSSAASGLLHDQMRHLGAGLQPSARLLSW